MAAQSVVTRGFGPNATIALVVTAGYVSDTATTGVTHAITGTVTISPAILGDIDIYP